MAQHDLLRDRINLAFHVKTVAIDVNKQNTKVGTTKIERQEFAVFCAVKKWGDRWRISGRMLT